MPDRTASILALALAFTLGCLAARSVPEIEEPTARAAAPEGVARWEYRCIDTGIQGIRPKANELGLEGWEMVAVDEAQWCFKRPL